MPLPWEHLFERMRADVEPDEQLALDQGGLFRCCIDTYEKFAPPAEHTAEGMTMQCGGCQATIEVRGGVWRWRVPPT